MRDILLLVAAALLFGVAQSRSVHLDLVSLVKNIASRGEGAGTNGDLLNNRFGGNEGTGEAGEAGVENNSKVGFILFGNLEDLEKYRIDVKENEDDNKYNSETIINSAYGVNENTNDLEVNPQISVEIQDSINEKEEENKEEQKINDGIFINLQDDYEEEDDDSEDYENVDETDGKDKIVIDIFSEDEYNDYNDKDNAAEDVSNEEDESKEEQFYDEDEKYYENENDKFNIPQNNGGEIPFDGIFMEDSKK